MRSTTKRAVNDNILPLFERNTQYCMTIADQGLCKLRERLLAGQGKKPFPELELELDSPFGICFSQGRDRYQKDCVKYQNSKKHSSAFKLQKRQ